MRGLNLKMATPQPLASANSRVTRRRSGRLTPYGQSRREPDIEDSVEDPLPRPLTQNRGVLKNYVSRVCHMYRVSPLWKFVASQHSLQTYSEQLTGLLGSVVPEHVRARGRRPSYVGVVSVVKDFGSVGSHCVQVTVRRSSSGQAHVPECCAMICSTSQSPTVEKGFTYLPWMLVCGPSNTAQVVIDWVKNSFDCCINDAKLDQGCLHSIADHYATTQRRSAGGRGEKAGGLKLVYNLPEAVRKAGLTSIKLDLPYGSVLALDKGHSLCNTLEQLIHQHFHLKLSMVTLASVTSPVIHIDHNGTAKFLHGDDIVGVLSLIQQSLLPR